uniref:histidine kinase dimerization/phospho-acceptor domain-containing protein n=1 Tax=Pseudomonas sp. TWR3-1-1 TaxID=2804633 RepID=UPI003CFB7864
MRLSDFIEDNIAPILQAWEDFARTILTTGVDLDRDALRDHAEEMLRVIIADLRSAQTKQEQVDKSKGQAPRVDNETAAEIHAVTRLLDGFSIEQMVSEYRALRASVLGQWAACAKDGTSLNVDDLIRFNEAIDQALAESVASYSRAVEASRSIFLGILGHDLRTPLGAILLGSDILKQSEKIGSREFKVASQIRASVMRANRIVGDLLDLTRTQLGAGIPVQKTYIDLSELCERVVREIRAFHPEADVQFVANNPVSSMFDGPRLEQVFSNIISNAVSHGDVCLPITVKLSMEEDEAIII